MARFPHLTCGAAGLTMAVSSWAVTEAKDVLSGGDPLLGGAGSFANAA